MYAADRGAARVDRTCFPCAPHGGTRDPVPRRPLGLNYEDQRRAFAEMAVIEAHEHPDESFRKTAALLEKEPDISGIYVNTVNCLPVCRALAAVKSEHSVRVITTDLFHKMISYFERGTIAASIHQQPYIQGQLAVRSLVEHLLHGAELVRTQYLNPNIILRSNLHLFREAKGVRSS